MARDTIEEMREDLGQSHAPPKVAFIYAFPLDRERRRFFETQGREGYPSVEEVKSTLNRWTHLWNDANDDGRIVRALIEIVGRAPERGLECFVIGSGLGPMSTPLILPVMGKNGIRSDQLFLETLIHEVVHVFVSQGFEEYWKSIRDTYCNEPTIVQNHIIVYAILESICKTFFNTDPIDYSRDNMPDGYAHAIAIVKENGYETCIREFQHISR